MSLLGWGSLALGAASIWQGYEASKSQEAAISAQTSSSAQALAFQRQQYQHVLDVYGSAEQNLSEYYQSLTPEEYKTRGLDAYDTQFKQAQESWSSQMAQRGLAGSGIEAEGMLGMEMQGAQNRATIDATANQQWAADQMSWLGLGMGQQNVAAQGVAGAQQNIAAMYGQQSGVYGQQAAASGQALGSLIGSTMGAVAYNPNSSYAQFWGA